jgi:hypothetical protein
MSSEMLSKSSQSDHIPDLRLRLIDQRLSLIDRRLELISRILTSTSIDGFISNLKVDSKADFFLHRRNLDQSLLNKVLRSTNGGNITVLKGINGSGKTLSAINLANKLLNDHNFKYKFFDCSFDLEDQFLDILQNDYKMYHIDNDLIIETFVNKIMSEKSNILLIFDNAAKSQEIKEILAKLPAKIRILIITSREDFKITSMTRNSEDVICGGFSEKQTTKFLKSCASVDLLKLSKDEFNELVNIMMTKGFILPTELNKAIEMIDENLKLPISQLFDMLKTLDF